MPVINEMAHEVFGSDLPDVRDLEKKIVLALVNAHPSVDLPEPLGPNVIPVGGLQVRDPPHPLPKVKKKMILNTFKTFNYMLNSI